MGGEADEMDVSSCHPLFGVWRNATVLGMTLNCSRLKGWKAGRLASGLFFAPGL